MLLIKKILCFILNHKFVVIENLSYDAQKLCCKRCHRIFSINHSVKTILEWDYEFEMMYSGHYYVNLKNQLNTKL